MQDSIGIPACFSSDHSMDDSGAVTRSGQSVFMSIYRTKLAGQCRLITVSWCKNMLFHGLSVSFEGVDNQNQNQNPCSCKIEMKPWYFWRKHGSKRFQLEGKAVEVFWDLRTAKFNGETEPKSDYYVAVVCEEEVVLILGDMKKDAYKKTKSRPALIEPILISRKEHIFGKRSFSTRAKLNEKGKSHEISIECNTRLGASGRAGKSGHIGIEIEPEMVIKVDGVVATHVKHLQWKFRGNECISVNKGKIEIYWDVHDWLFSPGLRHALFIFKPISSSTYPSPISSSSSSSQTANSSSTEGYYGNANSSDIGNLGLSMRRWCKTVVDEDEHVWMSEVGIMWERKMVGPRFVPAGVSELDKSEKMTEWEHAYGP